MVPQHSLKRPSRQTVHGLDAIRFMAAILVVTYHLGFKAWALDGSTLHAALLVSGGQLTASPPLYWLTWSGWIGVQIFFVVSGAVIGSSTTGTGAMDFARRRVTRLWPAILMAVPLAFAVSATQLAVPLQEAAWLSFKTLVFAPVGPWIMGQFWTIPIELAFYAQVWLLLVAGFTERGMRVLMWALGLASALYWVCVAFGWTPIGGRLSALLLLQHGCYFAIGMACARLGRNTVRWRHCILVIACVAAAAFQIHDAAEGEMGSQRADLAALWPLAYAVWLFFTAATALSFLYCARIAACVGRLHTLLKLLGMTTYPLYLIHMHLGGVILLATAAWGVAPAYLFALAASVAVAAVMAQWLEPPLRKAIDPLVRGLLQRLYTVMRRMMLRGSGRLSFPRGGAGPVDGTVHVRGAMDQWRAAGERIHEAADLAVEVVEHGVRPAQQ